MADTKKSFEAIVSVSSSGQPLFISSTDDELGHLMDGLLFEDNSTWETMLLFPKEPGVYSMTIEYQFEQGYWDGYPNDGQSTWDFIPSNMEMLFLSKMTHIDEQKVINQSNAVGLRATLKLWWAYKPTIVFCDHCGKKIWHNGPKTMITYCDEYCAEADDIPF